MLTFLIKEIVIAYNKSDRLPLFYNNLLNKMSMVSHFLGKFKRFSSFERRFPYLLLWNSSDGNGWEIFRGAWNAWHKNWGYRVSVSSLYISPLWYGVCELLFVISYRRFIDLTKDFQDVCYLQWSKECMLKYFKEKTSKTQVYIRN
jgi:hypothetical protein